MQTQVSKAINRIKTISRYGLGQSIPILSVLVISYIIIKNHSVSLWGAYVELLLWVNFMALFTYFGNKNYLLKTFSENPGHIYSSWNSNFLSRGLLFFILIAFIWVFPFFDTYPLLIIAWVFLLFYNQAFEVLVLYQRDFTFNLYVELVRNAVVIAIVLWYHQTLSLKVFLQIILVGLLIKAICYSFFYFRSIKKASISLDIKSLKRSIPFFIPMVLGTIRTKIDAYYGTVFFTKEELSKYQIFISLIGLVQMGATYIINPYIKTLYRISNKTRRFIEQKSYLLGGFIGGGALLLIYGVIEYVYGFQFSTISYVLAYTFIITLFLHLLLINEFYKENQQMLVAVVIAITAGVQLLLGYFAIKTYQEEGALAIKALGQWAMVIALLLLRKKMVKSTN